MIKTNQIEKPKVLRCRTDKTRCRLRCPKCLKNTSFSKLFKSPENIWRHLYQVHRIDENEFPTTKNTIQILEKISFALQQKIPIEDINEAKELKMVIK